MATKSMAYSETILMHLQEALMRGRYRKAKRMMTILIQRTPESHGELLGIIASMRYVAIKEVKRLDLKRKCKDEKGDI